jgi:glutathione S-transferase
MPRLKLTVLSLRYSSWSMRPWLALTHAGADFDTETVELTSFDASIAERRALGSIRGLFPVLRIDGAPVHESLAICEYAADAFPEARLWPEDAIERARARAISLEMVSGFTNLRREMLCHLFGRVAAFEPSRAAQDEIARVLEIWSECLERWGGPFLFGGVSIADFMYYPVLTRLRTYGVPVTGNASDYARALEQLPAVAKLVEVARREPAIGVYDEYLRDLGGDPEAAL